jgi:hypothetical protein
MTQISEISGDIVERIAIPAQATAGTDEAYNLMRADKNIVIIGARIIWNADITGAATNHCAFGVVNKGAAGAGTTAVTAVKAYDDAVNAAKWVPETLTPSATAANLNVASGDVLVLDRTTPGTGLASPSGIVELTYRYR